jgi:hypothetical protein
MTLFVPDVPQNRCELQRLQKKGLLRTKSTKNIPRGLKSVRENGLPELEKNPFGSKAAS